jgi:hypothetical protein
MRNVTHVKNRSSRPGTDMRTPGCYAGSQVLAMLRFPGPQFATLFSLSAFAGS